MRCSVEGGAKSAPALQLPPQRTVQPEVRNGLGTKRQRPCDEKQTKARGAILVCFEVLYETNVHLLSPVRLACGGSVCGDADTHRCGSRSPQERRENFDPSPTPGATWDINLISVSLELGLGVLPCQSLVVFNENKSNSSGIVNSLSNLSTDVRSKKLKSGQAISEPKIDNLNRFPSSFKFLEG